jgi:cyanophycinase
MGQLIDGSFAELRGLSFDPRGKPGDLLAALGFEWRLYKAPGSIGWSSPEGGDEDYTVHRLGLDVLPVRMAQPLYGPWAAPAAR